MSRHNHDVAHLNQAAVCSESAQPSPAAASWRQAVPKPGLGVSPAPAPGVGRWAQPLTQSRDSEAADPDGVTPPTVAMTAGKPGTLVASGSAATVTVWMRPRTRIMIKSDSKQDPGAAVTLIRTRPGAEPVGSGVI